MSPEGVASQFINNARGFAALIAWLGEHQVARVVVESTGAYHHAFERQLGKAGLPMVIASWRSPRRPYVGRACEAASGAVGVAGITP